MITDPAPTGPDRADSGRHAERRPANASGQAGFTLTEIMIAMMVFTVVIGSVVALLGESQNIFRTQQGVSDMDQNARLMMDFLTRDIQESKENAIGLGDEFKPIFSYNGPSGTTDQVTIMSSETQSKVPAAALPFVPVSQTPFAVGDARLEVLPNPAGQMTAESVLPTITPGEQMIMSAVRADGSVQFDVVKIMNAGVTKRGTLQLNFEQAPPQGIDTEVPFGSTYSNGAFSVRPVEVTRYYVDRANSEHPVFAMSRNAGPPIPIGRNIVGFQIRYLQVKDGDTIGQWVVQQNVSHLYNTVAVEVTLTARTEIKADKKAARLLTLASVIRPRFQPGSGNQYGSGMPSGGLPGGGTVAGGGSGNGQPGLGAPGSGPGSGNGADGNGGADGGSGIGVGLGGPNNNTQRIGDPNSIHLHHDTNNDDQSDQ